MDISKISFYYFNPLHENLPEETGFLRLICTIASGILTLGFIPMVMAIFYRENFADLTHQPSRTTKRVGEVFDNTVALRGDVRPQNPHSPPTITVNGEDLSGEDRGGELKPAANLEFRNAVQQILENEHHNVDELIEEIFDVIDPQIPHLKDRFDSFSSMFQNHIETIIESGGWDSLKNELGLKMASPYCRTEEAGEEGISFEAFRTEVNGFIQRQVNVMLTHLGIGAIKVKIFGTRGWNSDVDIGMRSESKEHPLTTEEMVIAKILCELSTMRVLGKFPGIGLDTEWYVDLRFLAGQLETDEAEKKFYTIDFIMAFVQAYKNLSKEAWKEYKRVELSQVRDDKEKELLETIFSFIKSLSKERDKAGKRAMILKEKDDQLIKKGAGTHTLKIRKQSFRNFLRRANTGQIDGEYKKIVNGRKEKRYNAQLLSDYRYLLNLAKQCSAIEARINEIGSSGQENVRQKELEDLLLEHDIHFAIINASQPESIYTLSGINSTLYVRGGQKYQRIQEQKIKEFGKWYKEGSISLSDLSGFIKSQENIDAPGLRDYISEKIEEKRSQLEEAIEKIFDRAPESNSNQLLVATAERLAQFKHVLEQKDDIVDASKYLLRIVEGLYETLEIAERENISENSLKQRVNKFLRLARRLEKCKRKFAINGYIARKNLLKTAPLSPDREPELKTIFKGYEKRFNGGLYKKSEKLSYLTRELVEKFEIETAQNSSKILSGNVIPADQEIFSILQAFVGYSRQKHPELEPYHKSASDATLEHHQDLIARVKSEIHELCIQVRQHMQNNQLAYELSEEAIDLFQSVPDDFSSGSSEEPIDLFESVPDDLSSGSSGQ